MSPRERPVPDDPKKQELERDLKALRADREEAQREEEKAVAAVAAAVQSGRTHGLKTMRLVELSGMSYGTVKKWFNGPAVAAPAGGWSEDVLSAAADLLSAAAQDATRARDRVAAVTEKLIEKVREGAGLGLKQAQLARLAGVDPTTIRSWDGRPEPDPARVAEYEETLTALGLARADAREAERKATAAVAKAVRIGAAAGLSENRLASLAGVHRPQIRSWLAEDSSVTVPRRWSETKLTAAAAKRAQAREQVKKATDELAELVRECAAYGLTQARMAELTGVSDSTIKTWLGLRDHNPAPAK